MTTRWCLALPLRGTMRKSAAGFDKPGVRALIAQACALVSGALAEALAKAPPLQTMLKSVAAKQRARRPA